MLMAKCFTCGKLLSDVEIPWNNKKKECENDLSLSKEDQLNIMAKYLDELKITSRCCRKCLLTNVDQINIIM